MDMYCVQVTLAEVAYMERLCQYITDALRQVESAVQGVRDLSGNRSVDIAQITHQQAAVIRDHLESAGRTVEEWTELIESTAT